MKKTLLFVLLFVFSGVLTFGQTVTVHFYGQVTTGSNNAPVANQAVIIQADSSSSAFSFDTIVYTNANGAYFTNVPVPTGLQVLFHISTLNCNGVYLNAYGVNTNSPLINNFNICTTTPPPCNAAFSVVPDSLNPLHVHFINNSSGSNLSYHWSFGNSTNSTLMDPYVTYAQAGTYTVCLIISNTTTPCLDTVCQTITVGNSTSCQAHYQYYASTSNALEIHFTDLSTGTPTTWYWAFGDATTSTLQNPVHTYSQSGTYTVCLHIGNANGCTNYYCHSVIVSNNPSPCQASFTALPDTNSLLTIHFTNTSTGSPTSYSWTFGDGGTSTSFDPHHTYSAPGLYLVCLTISGPNNCQSVFCDSINVSGSPPPCSNYITFYQQLLSFHFQGHASGGTAPYSYAWDFGDGTNSILQNPTHSYTLAGTYTVILITTDANGCVYTSTLSVTATTAPSTYDLYGTVYAGSNTLDVGHVTLYGTNGSNAFTVIAYTAVDSIGHYHFGGVAAGTYYIKAIPTPNSVYYSTYLPTYYPHNTLWSFATAIVLGTPSNPYNIDLEQVMIPAAGPGQISGNVIQGAKSTLSGTPVSGAEVLLQSDAGTTYMCNYSDALGNYAFTNLAFGTYKIYTEVAGLVTYPATVSLSASNPAIGNINITITSTAVLTSVPDLPAEEPTAFGQVYPNPVSQLASMNVNLARAQKLDIFILDMLGQTAYSSTLSLSKGNHRIDINTSGLNTGTYQVQILMPDGSQVMRKISIVR